MKFNEQAYRQLAERVTRSYEALGRDGLTKLSSGELSVLYAEFSVNARIAANLFRTDPSELNELRKQRADAAMKDVGSFIREQERSKEIER
jgi:hypothetical protein